MTFNKACGIADPYLIPWTHKMDLWVNLITRDALRPFLPKPAADLAMDYISDKNFNNTPLSVWEEAAGYSHFQDRQGQAPPVPKGPFPNLLKSKGVTSYSMSELVSLLKRAAELEVLDYLYNILSQRSELYAVFKNMAENPDPMNRHNVYDYECIAAFPSKPAAESLIEHNKDAGQFVCKPIKLPESDPIFK